MRVVVAIAECGSIARAANALHLSPSAVAHSLHVLERELGAALFRRIPRGMALTDAGEQFLPAARRALHEVVLAGEAVDQVRGLHTGRLTIIATRSSAVVPLAELVTSFVREYPDVLIEIQPTNTPELVAESVRSGECDIGFTSAAATLDDLRAEPIYRHPIGIAVASGHRLAGQSSVALGDFDGEPVVAPLRTSPYRQHFDARCKAAGITPHVVVEAGTQDMMLALVRGGVGAALSTMDVNCAGVVVLPLDPPLETTVVVVLRRSQQPTAAALALYEMARRTYNANS